MSFTGSYTEAEPFNHPAVVKFHLVAKLNGAEKRKEKKINNLVKIKVRDRFTFFKFEIEN